MNAKLGESTKLRIKDKTVDGVIINVFMAATALNTGLVALTDFVAKSVNLKVTLYRNKENKEIVGDNLQILSIYSQINYAINGFYRGNILVFAAPAAKEIMLLSMWVPFGGPINVKGDDELSIEMNAGIACFSGNVDTGTSFISFLENAAIGYEVGTPTIRSQPVTQGASSDNFSVGDTCTKAAFLQLDMTSLFPNVINSMSLASKQLNWQLDYFSLQNKHWNNFVSPTIQWRYDNTIPLTAGTEEFIQIPKFPQTIILFVGTRDKKSYLDNCQLTGSFVSANVNGGMNFFMATCLKMSQQLIARANEKAEKHNNEKIEGLPVLA